MLLAQSVRTGYKGEKKAFEFLMCSNGFKQELTVSIAVNVCGIAKFTSDLHNIYSVFCNISCVNNGKQLKFTDSRSGNGGGQDGFLTNIKRV